MVVEEQLRLSYILSILLIVHPFYVPQDRISYCVVVMGDDNVGKTFLVSRLMNCPLPPGSGEAGDTLHCMDFDKVN